MFAGVQDRIIEHFPNNGVDWLYSCNRHDFLLHPDENETLKEEEQNLAVQEYRLEKEKNQRPATVPQQSVPAIHFPEYLALAMQQELANQLKTFQNFVVEDIPIANLTAAPLSMTDHQHNK